MTMLRVTVGAAMDRSFETTLNSLVAATAKAQKRIGSEEAKGNRERRREAEESVKAAERAQERATVRAEKAAKRAANAARDARRQQTREAFQAADEQARAAEKAAQRAIAASNNAKLAQVRNIRQWTQVGIQGMNLQTQNLNAQLRQQAAMIRAANLQQRTRALNAKLHPNALGQMYNVFQAGGPLSVANVGARVLSAGAAAVGSMARGYGAETDIDSIMAKNTSHEALAAKIAASGYRPDDPANARLVGTRELMQEQFDVGKKHGFSGTAVAEAQDQIQKLTGDLQGARDITDRIAFYARATGTDLREAGELFGKTMSAYDPKIDKGKRASMATDVMMAYAGQGKMGSVEIEDAAKVGGRLAGLSIRAGGDLVHGQKEAMALLQLANPLKTGDPSAGATAVEAWYGQFGKDARKKGYAAFGLTEAEKAADRRKGLKPGQGVEGVKIRDEFGNMRGQKDIILDILRRSGGSKDAVERVMKDKNAQIVFSSVWKTFDQTAGSFEEKIAGVAKSLDDLTNATLGDKEAVAMHAKNMSTAQAKAEQFNVAMAQIIADLQANLAPAFEALAPVVLALSSAIVKAIGEITGGTGRKLEEQEGATKGAARGMIDELRDAMKKDNVTPGLIERAKATLLKTSGESRQERIEADELNKMGALETGARVLGGMTSQFPLLAPVTGMLALGEKHLKDTREGDYTKTNEGAIRAEEEVNILRKTFRDAATKVHVTKDDTQFKPPPAHSPLGGHQAIAAGC